jgi:acyl-CoA thioesterase
MGDLGNDTQVAGANGSYTAMVSDDWELWGPQGGYIASLALRAAGAETGRARPASINVSYLSAAAFEPVDIDVVVTRTTRFASAASITMTQGDRTVLTAQVWGVDAMGGIEHQTAATPGVTNWQDLADIKDLLPDDAEPPHPFWQNLQERPLNFVTDWQNRVPGEPTSDRWYRFVPASSFDDPWVDACRMVVLLDVDGWAAACAAHSSPMDYFAPTIEFTARFVGVRGSEWLLSRARAPVATGGLVAATAELWNDDQTQLVATGGSTLLCLPSSRRPDQ